MKKIFNYNEIEKINIEKIIARFGEDYRINGKGNLDYNCPFCVNVRGKVDTDHKFVVDVKTTVYNCFKCHTSGIIVKNKLSNAEKVVPFLIDYFKENVTESQTLNSNKLIELKDVIPISKNSIAYEYLKNRQITDEQIEYYNLLNGVDNNLGRIIIPNMVISKWTDYYQGRSFLNSNPKYLNPENIDKSNIVFNLHNQTKKQKRVYIVEGVFSAIRAGKDVVCIYGSSVSDVQIELIKKYKFKEIYCCLDGDEAGIIGNRKLSDLLYEKTNSDIYTIKLPVDKDPADLGEYKFKEYCEKYKKPYLNKSMNKILSYFD